MNMNIKHTSKIMVDERHIFIIVFCLFFDLLCRRNDIFSQTNECQMVNTPEKNRKLVYLKKMSSIIYD